MPSKPLGDATITISDDDLLSVNEFDQTPLKRLRRRARYELLRRGAIPYVAVGKRLYVRRSAIYDFLRACERKTGNGE